MYERLERLYKMGRLDINGLINAVKKHLITETQFYRISGVTYEEATGNKAGEGENAPKSRASEEPAEKEETENG